MYDDNVMEKAGLVYRAQAQTNLHLCDMMYLAVKDNRNGDGEDHGPFGVVDLRLRTVEECHDGSRTAVYDVLVCHAPREDNGHNCTGYGVYLRDRGDAEARYNGTALLLRNGRDGRWLFAENSIWYGSFTKEMSGQWLAGIAATLNAEVE